MSTERFYSTNRAHIVKAMVDLINGIDSLYGTDGYTTKLNGAVYPKLILWDKIVNSPTVCISSSDETIEYMAGRNKMRILTVNVRVFLKQDDPLSALEAILADIETMLETNSNFSYTDRYGTSKKVTDVSITSSSTDEGVLDPLAIGEISLVVKYL